MTLQGCGDERPASPGNTPVAVELVSRPSADLLRCADRAAPLPEDQVAILPAGLRVAMIMLAKAFAANADQLDRLVDWNDPAAACGKPEKK